MKPNPLSMRRRAMVPVGIPVSSDPQIPEADLRGSGKQTPTPTRRSG
jgi:hypothetical protein